MNCLILPCSQRKRDPHSLPNHIYDSDSTVIAPAWDVYDGPLARIVRKYAPYRDLDIWFLSARFGLISRLYRIPLYDQKMTIEKASNADWIGTHITVPWLLAGVVGSYEAVYTCLPRLYEVALAAGLAHFGVEPVVVQKLRGQGYMCQALKRFLAERRQCQ